MGEHSDEFAPVDKSRLLDYSGNPAASHNFVLDRTENPHPRMLGEALLARSIRFDSPQALAYWHGYLAAMSGATGCEMAEIEAWMDHHDKGVSHVPLPVRRL